MRFEVSVYGEGTHEGSETDTTVYTLTDEHPTCSYGQPVLLIDGLPHSWREAAAKGVNVHPAASLGSGQYAAEGRTPEYFLEKADRKALLDKWFAEAIRCGATWHDAREI